MGIAKTQNLMVRSQIDLNNDVQPVQILVSQFAKSGWKAGLSAEAENEKMLWLTLSLLCQCGLKDTIVNLPEPSSPFYIFPFLYSILRIH
jgi:hypothetical protein